MNLKLKLRKKRAAARIIAVMLVMAVVAGAFFLNRDSVYAGNRTYGNNNWETARNQQNGAPQPTDSFDRNYGSIYNIYYDVGKGSGQKATTYSNYSYETVLRVDGTWAFVGNNEEGQKAACAPDLTVNGVWCDVSVSEIAKGQHSDSFALVTFRLHNETGEVKTADLATMADLDIGGDDNAPLKKLLDKGAIVGFTATNSYLQDIADDDKITLYYHFKDNNYIKRNATTVWIGVWADRFNNMWREKLDNVNDPVEHSGSTGDPNAVDTGFAASWLGIEIQPHGTEEITFTLDVVETNAEYIVKYDGNGATWGTVSDQHCKYNEPFTISANGYVKNGYTFTGWNTVQNPTADNPGYSYLPGDEVSDLIPDSSGEITLYAQWAPSRTFIEYDGNGADSTTGYIRGYWADGAALSTDEKYDLDSAFSKAGYSFRTWDVYRQTLGTHIGEKTSADSVPSVDGITSLVPANNLSNCIEIVPENNRYADYSEMKIGTASNAETQRFAFEWAGKDGGGDYYLIRHEASGKVLDVNGEAADGDSDKHMIRLYRYTEDSVFQQWYVEYTGDNGYVKLSSRWNGGYMDNYNGQLYIYSGNDNASQRWSLPWVKFNAYAQWTNNNYSVQYDADGGTLYDTDGNETEDNTQDCAYDTTYSFYTADRAYTISYEPNGGTVNTTDTNTNAQAAFNGWNRNASDDTEHEILKGSFKNLTADGGTVYVKANYTNGSITLPAAEKKSMEENGVQTTYEFEGWYSDKALTKRVGGADENYTPDSDLTLYAKYTDDSEKVLYNQKISVRYENADGSWGEYEDWLDSDFKTGDTVLENWENLDTSKWVKPEMIQYQVEGSYAVNGYETKVDIKRRTYAVRIKYDSSAAFTDKCGEGRYRWGETVTAGVTIAESTPQYIYEWNGFGIPEEISLEEESTEMSNPVTFIMPEKDTELLAYSSNKVNMYMVMVEHYYMDVQGRYPDTATEVQDISSLEYGTELVYEELQQDRIGFTYNGEKTSGENGAQVVTTVTSDSIIRLYYDRNRYTVVYQGNKGEAVQNIPAALSVYYDEEFAISPMVPTRAGFTFINWNTKAEGRGIAFESGQTAKNLTAENNGTVILYAQWEQKKFQVVSSASNRGSSRKFIKRTSDDGRWYETSGRLSAEELLTVPEEECLAVMYIDQSGAITRQR